jgi:hypothetical protein
LQCPHLQKNTTSYDEKLRKKTNTYHGAKNSTSVSFSASITELMLEGVKSTTSEAASARARVARVREKVEVRIDEIRILEKERDVKQRRRGLSLI